jgi:DNA invertase Pin-like site-specific DNA recombinase
MKDELMLRAITIHANSQEELERYNRAIRRGRTLARADSIEPGTSCHISFGHYVTPDAARDYTHHVFQSALH